MRTLLIGVTILPLTLLGTPPASAEPSPGHVVVDVRGAVDFQRSGWSGRSRVQVGTLLRLGDLLYPKEGSAMTIVCADLSLARVSGAPTPVPCRVERADITVRGYRVSAARSGGDAYPVLLAPRGTVVLEDRPTIRWLPVRSTTTHVVTVEGRNLRWQSAPLTANELAYPKTAPPLQPDVPYQVTVTAGARSSADDGQPGSGFMIANAELTAFIQTADQRVSALGLSASSHRIVLARLYASRRLNELAVQTLEPLAGSRNPAALLLRSELFLDMGRRDEAKSDLQGLLGYLPEEDLEGRAYVRSLLGRLSAASQREVALPLIRDAIALYSALGDQGAAEDLEKWRRSLSN